MTSPQALAARDLNKRFGSLVVARNITFDLPRGARYALIGPNGAGKTTLINLLTGLLRPDGGQIFLEGADITAVQPAARVKRGLVRTFQINALFPQLSPLEAVTLAVCERRGEAAAWWRPLPAHRDAVEEAYEVLTSVGLAADSQRETRALAYGQQRLLEMALALATRPRVLLLDEPAAGMNTREKADLMVLIRQLKDQFSLGILVIEHDMKLVMGICEQITVLDHGETISHGTPQEVRADRKVIEAYLGDSYLESQPAKAAAAPVPGAPA